MLADPRTFLDLLAARRGLVCTAGAGGKKSTLYRLVEAHRAAGTARIGLSATVMTAAPPARIASNRLVAEPEVLIEQVPVLARREQVVAYGRPSPKPGRLAGLAPALIASLHGTGGFAVTLVKADGARMRLIKAPAPDEPVLPPGAGTVLALVSARVIGRVLDESVAHRPERVGAVTGAAPGEPLSPEHVGRLLASEEGALQHAGRARVVPVINMVDDAERRVLAVLAARTALALSDRFERVLLTSMTAPEPIVEVVERPRFI